ncbi:MAG: phosphopantetheine-protein transferase [Desulfuromonas sp.]|nr:MAG: phosphopantetheine-protein transferase [Desulfuromonas sp.]
MACEPLAHLPLSPWRSPPETPSLSGGRVDLWRFRLDPPESELPRLKQLLCPDELNRAARLIDPVKRARFIVGRARLRQVLARYFALAPKTLEFCYGEHGKPSLGAPPHQTFRFNLSHAGLWGVFAISAGSELGVDVELIDPELGYDKVAEHYFSPAEVECWKRYPELRRRRAFYRIWTRKEALLKAQGGGFTAAQTSSQDGWVLRSFALSCGYLGALAVTAKVKRVQRWDLGYEDPC